MGEADSKSSATRIGRNGVRCKSGVYDRLTTKMTRSVDFKIITLTAIAGRYCCLYDGHAHRVAASLRVPAINSKLRDLIGNPIHKMRGPTQEDLSSFQRPWLGRRWMGETSQSTSISIRSSLACKLLRLQPYYAPRGAHA